GQIFLETDLFNSGVRPAVNPGISVSRVGGSAQVKGMRQVAGSLRLDLAQFRELESFAQFGSDLDAATQQQLVRGSRLIEILKQKQYEPLPVEKQIMIIFAANGGFLDDINESDLAAFESELYAYTETKDESLLNDIREQSKLDDALEGRLEKVIADFKNVFVK
ncbi:MAG: F0F1 ATP synthase subunit alpha, partial [Candidatus Binatia bacterium]|nr:F0F1 ATP synthase subunit alpha [Candidatus Binatia bacterium]